jgi:hypothetical protein
VSRSIGAVVIVLDHIWWVKGGGCGIFPGKLKTLEYSKTKRQ